jgi:hypothetical protein
MAIYYLKITEQEPVQHPDDTSFIGGHPRLPAEVELPVCKLCEALQTFYFQVAFPPDHIWGGYSLAVFACTACQPEDHLVPKMLPGRRKPLDIPADFFADYQLNFRFCVFPTVEGQMRQDYEPRVCFYRWQLLRAKEELFGEDDDDRDSSKLGGQPGWLQFDDSPTTYNGCTPMRFLMQIEEDFEFETVANAPPQMWFDFSEGVMAQQPLSDTEYLLFLGNAIYFFGPSQPDQRLIYVVVQN